VIVAEYREGDVKSRVRGTDAKVKNVINTMPEYDLSPLVPWCGSGSYRFKNLGGTEADFAGADIGLSVENESVASREYGIQDKWRSTGDDLGQEIGRIYEYDWEDGRKDLILDAGRDLFRIPPIPIVTRNGKFAERKWGETQTVSDFFLFHNRKPDSPRTFIKSKAAKAIGKGLFLCIRKNWEFIAPDIQDRVFNKSKTINLSSDLGTKLFVTALREPTKAKGSTKIVLNHNFKTDELVVVPEVYCWIAKIIVYIPLDHFTDDQIKFCPRK